MDAKSELESLMPDSLTRWILGLSILIASILYSFYHDLPKSWIPQTEEQQFLTRLLLSGSALLLGSVTLVVLLASHDKMMRLQNAELKDALDAVSSDAQDKGRSIKTLQPLLAANAKELDALKKSYLELERIANERKSLLDTAETADTVNPDILFTKSVISQIKQNRSINQPSSPRMLSRTLKLSPECLLSHMMKMHNDKLITFITGGKQPDLDTDFFLSPEE